MGQSNQCQNQQSYPTSSCCLSRRYIIHKNIQKENKIKSKNLNKQPPLSNQEFHIHSKQPLGSKTGQKPLTDTEAFPNKQFKPNQENLNQQKPKFEEIGNLELESHLVEKIEDNNKPQDFRSQKKETLQQPDISEENERNSTRQNSLSSRNFSNKNSISNNNHKLRNKIQNLKFKYITQNLPPKQASFIQPLPKIASQKETNLTNNNEGNQFTISLFPKQLFPSNDDLLQSQGFPMNKNQASEKIQFFSQNSDSNSSCNSPNPKNEDFNEEMLNSKKIDFIVHELNRNKKNENKIKQIAQLERIPEESQRIQWSKSQDEGQNSNNKKINKNPRPQQISQQSFYDQIKNTPNHINIQKYNVQNTQTRIPKKDQGNNISIKQKTQNLILLRQGSHFVGSKKAKSPQDHFGKVQSFQKILSKKITTNIPKSSKRIIAF